MDPAALLQQIFGKQAAQPMQISGQTGMGAPGPSKFNQFGSLLQLIGGAGGGTTVSGDTRQQASELMKSLFGGMGMKQQMRRGGGGGRPNFSMGGPMGGGRTDHGGGMPNQRTLY